MYSTTLVPDVPHGTLCRREGAAGKRKLVDRAIVRVGEHGIADLSLRAMAAALGARQRMLRTLAGRTKNGTHRPDATPAVGRAQ